MARTTRTFIAFAVPEVQRNRLGRLQGLIAPDLPNARWLEPALFHVTLAFLGDIPDADLNVVCRAVAEAAKDFRRFTLNLQGLGAFPDPSKPRVVWVGLTGPGLDALARLQRSIVQAVDEVGYPPEDDRFSPHLTLGRLKPRKGDDLDMTPLVAHFQTWSAGNFDVSSVVTYSSTLTPEGPTYAALASAPFGREK